MATMMAWLFFDFMAMVPTIMILILVDDRNDTNYNSTDNDGTP
jgi:hypothetical protein